jgi:NAD(P)-dependent dehydrogenase (short-subunit alcohol dehydrogenase family)
MTEFEGRLVAVTGAASGIGRAIALRFAAEGATVAAIDRDERGLASVVAELEVMSSAIALPVDLSAEDEVAEMGRVLAERGPVASLVNQAGIIRRGDIRTMTLAEWETIHAVNVTSMFLVCRAVVPGMLEAGGGTIVNCASGAAFSSGRSLAAYTASKGAVLALTRSLAVDFAPTIRANAVCPGLIETPGAYLDTTDEMAASRREAATRTPLARMGTADEVAEAVLFFASRRSSYCSGSALVVDGGKLASA